MVGQKQFVYTPGIFGKIHRLEYNFVRRTLSLRHWEWEARR